MTVPTILVTGPVGVGKTTLIGEMGMLLAEAKIAHATVDLDQLRACYPRPADDDVWGTKLGLSNLAAIWQNYRRCGAGHLLVASVIESRSEIEGFRVAVPGAEIVVVRLRASPEALQARVRQRGAGSDIQWHLDRAVELAALMDAQAVEDLLIETEGVEPGELARQALSRLGWLEPRASEPARPDR